MRTIEEIQADLRALAQELEQLKEKAAPEELDLEKMSSIAAGRPVKGHPLAEDSDAYKKRAYLIPLLAVNRYAGDSLQESLLYAHRIAWGMGYLSEGQTLRGEHLAAMQLSFGRLDECARLFRGTPLGMMLVLEMLVTAGAFTGGKKDALEYIAQMCTLLGLSKEEVTFLGNLAAVILTKDLSRYRCGIQNTYAVFDGYLEDIRFPRKLVFPKIKNPLKVREEGSEYEREYYFSGAEVEFSRGGTELVFSCEYVHLSPLALSLFGRRVKVLPKKETKSVLPYTYVFKRTIATSFSAEEYTQMEYEKRLALQNQYTIDATRVLSEPIGVQTHPLDTPTLARKWFERQEKRLQENL